MGGGNGVSGVNVVFSGGQWDEVGPVGEISVG